MGFQNRTNEFVPTAGRCFGSIEIGPGGTSGRGSGLIPFRDSQAIERTASLFVYVISTCILMHRCEKKSGRIQATTNNPTAIGAHGPEEGKRGKKTDRGQKI